jgi:hypothetical protein
MAINMDLIWVWREGKYFRGHGWTESHSAPLIDLPDGQITLFFWETRRPTHCPSRFDLSVTMPPLQHPTYGKISAAAPFAPYTYLTNFSLCTRRSLFLDRFPMLAGILYWGDVDE